MAVPYLGNALNGWTKKIPCKIVTQTVVNHKTQENENDVILDKNIQPIPQTKVDRKPEGQRTWKWWNLLIRNGQLLKIDDVVIINNKRFRIQSIGDWSESGFQNYEAIEDYQ